MSIKGHDFNDITGRIIGCAIEAHKTLGSGFQEVIYQRALALELDAAGIEYLREADIPIYYKGRQIGIRRVDFIIGDCIVELKARSEFLQADYVQAINYLKASGYRLGLLLNFGSTKVDIRRFVNDHPSYKPDMNAGD